MMNKCLFSQGTLSKVVTRDRNQQEGEFSIIRIKRGGKRYERQFTGFHDTY